MANNSGFSFNVKVRLNSTNKIIKNHGLDQNGRVVRYLRDTADRLMMPFIPGGAKGMMAKLKTYPNERSIKYTSPQAHYQFTGKLMLAKNGSSWAKRGEKKHYTNIPLKYHTSGTGDHWHQLMLQRRKDDLIKDVEDFIRLGG